MPQPLKPTLREKKRYVVYEPAGDEDVILAHKELFGIRGAANAGIKPVNQKNSRSILRVSHTSVDELKAAIAWSSRRSLITSGSLKKAKLHLQNLQE